jgi:hypothetical protein
MLAREFGYALNARYRGQYDKILLRIWSGEIDPGAVLHVYRHAKKPGVEKPGAYFWRALKERAGITTEDLAE